jgi:serine protease Do
MLSTRRIASTWHGLVVDDLTRGGQRAVVIREVQTGSPGESAGFKAGDEVTRVGELPVGNMLDLERGLLDSQPGRPTQLVVHRPGGDQTLALDVRAIPPGSNVVSSSQPGDQVWEILGIKTMPVSTDWVAAVSPKLRGGLYVEAVLPGSPAAQAAIQKGDILVGMNVGTRHWETIRPDNILYVLRQPEAFQTQGAVLYIVHRNGIQPRRISLADARFKKISQ